MRLLLEGIHGIEKEGPLFFNYIKYYKKSKGEQKSKIMEGVIK